MCIWACTVHCISNRQTPCNAMSHKERSDPLHLNSLRGEKITSFEPLILTVKPEGKGCNLSSDIRETTSSKVLPAQDQT